MNHSSLSVRFEAFVKTLDGFESIDALLRGADPEGKRRADYLLHNRQFVIEQKVLRSNPTKRPQRFVDKLADERGIRIYGRVSTGQVFSGQPDTEDLQRRMVLDLARVIDDNVAAADDQTADTRTIFNIPDAAGILVLLNESAGYLRPDVVHYALKNSFARKAEDGVFRYSANDGAVVISEAHSVINSPTQLIVPMFSFLAPQSKHSASVKRLSEMMIKDWVIFNNSQPGM